MTEKRTAAAVSDRDFTLADRRDLELDRTYGSQSFWRDALSRFIKNKGAVFGLIMIAVIVFLAFAGPALSGYDYRTQDMAQRNLPPHAAGLEFFPSSPASRPRLWGERRSRPTCTPKRASNT